jgi:drug/metabolite transporter (DMT)-like permease
VQGVLTAIVALLLYGRMVGLLSAMRGAAFVALTPAMTALLAIPILGEWPSAVDWMAVGLIWLGVYPSAAGRWQHRAFLGSSRRKCRGSASAEWLLLDLFNQPAFLRRV